MNPFLEKPTATQLPVGASAASVSTPPLAAAQCKVYLERNRNGRRCWAESRRIVILTTKREYL